MTFLNDDAGRKWRGIENSYLYGEVEWAAKFIVRAVK